MLYTTVCIKLHRVLCETHMVYTIALSLSTVIFGQIRLHFLRGLKHLSLITTRAICVWVSVDVHSNTHHICQYITGESGINYKNQYMTTPPTHPTPPPHPPPPPHPHPHTPSPHPPPPTPLTAKKNSLRLKMVSAKWSLWSGNHCGNASRPVYA